MAWVIAVLATVLALSIAPLAPTCSNDGSHLALGLALSDGHVALGPYSGFASIDHAVRDGVIYSDRAPGVAFLLVPLLRLGLDPRLLSAVAFGATLAVVYGWLLRDGCSIAVSVATALVGGTTLLLRYAPVLFAHSLGAFLLALSGRLATGRTRHGWVLGLALGWAAITEYALAPLVVAGALVAWRLWPSFYAGAAFPLVAAALYQWVAFGAPWRPGYDYQATFTAAHSLGGNFGGPLWSGLKSFVVEGKDSWGSQNFGLVWISPVLALFPLGVLAMGARLRWQAALLATVCIGYLLLYSKFVAFGAGTMDSRYYVPFLPLVLVALGHLLARVGWPAWVVVALLTGLGIANLLPHIASSPGWHDQLALHVPGIRAPHEYLGLVYEARGERDRASAEYEMALQVEPLTARVARKQLGDIRLKEGRLDDAVAVLTPTLAETPGDSDALFKLGTALLQQQRAADAIVFLERAAALAPDAAQTHNNLGVALAQQHRYGEAAAQFERTLALNPSHVNATRNLQWVRAQLGHP